MEPASGRLVVPAMKATGHGQNLQPAAAVIDQETAGSILEVSGIPLDPAAPLTRYRRRLWTGHQIVKVAVNDDRLGKRQSQIAEEGSFTPGQIGDYLRLIIFEID